jgi:hypothetical protein
MRRERSHALGLLSARLDKAAYLTMQLLKNVFSLSTGALRVAARGECVTLSTAWASTSACASTPCESG